MLELMALSLMLLSPSSTFGAEAFEIELSVSSTSVVLGEPLHLTAVVTNASAAPLTVVRGGETGFDLAFTTERTDGLAWGGCTARRLGRPRVYAERLAPDWAQTYSRTLRCLDEPGEYRIGCVASSRGALPGQRLAGGDATDAWSGRVECRDVTVRVTRPVNEDREAFDTLDGNPMEHRQRLLESHPTSIYAGYAILDGRPWALDPVAEIEMRGRDLATIDRDPRARPQMERREAARRERNAERAGLLERYLEARPDFVYAEFMRLELATRLAYLGEYERARALCAGLIERVPDTDEAGRAGELLEFLDQRGWKTSAAR